MNYITPTEAARRWDTTQQTVLKYCKTGQIENAQKVGNKWYIPESVNSPLVYNKSKKKFAFIDLFCGIGGFHQAMRNLGGECVFACDIDELCRKVYNENFCPNEEFPVYGNINDVINKNVIPKFDVLCGGFPCQTFSKAGLQNGFKIVENGKGEKDERGQLFYRIVDILKEHPECKFIILENVRNLADKKENWEIICSELKNQGFIITEDPIIASPHEFGIPQIRERVFILGIKNTMYDGRRKLPNGYLNKEILNIDRYKKILSKNHNCLLEILDDNVDDKYVCSPEIEEILYIWEEFKNNVKGLTSPFWIHKAGIGIYSRDEYKTNLEIGFNSMPKWKQDLVMKSRIMYENNYSFIDEWIKKYGMRSRKLLHQKFEWNAGKEYASLKDGIIQIRQSGIRVKRPNFFPSLVVMKNTPIVWDNKKGHFRYITPKEAAKLQSFDSNFIFSNIDSVTYQQLGNSVNVRIIQNFASELFKLGKKK